MDLSSLLPNPLPCDPLEAAKLAALASPCFFHRRIDDAVNIQDIIADSSVSHSRLLQTVTSVREAARQLQRRPMRRAVRNVMIVTKARDNDLVLLTRELAEWLLSTPRYGAEAGVNVYVDHKLKGSKRFDAAGLLGKDWRFEKMLRFWTPDMCWSAPEKFDLVLTLGGDGTVLFTSWLFQRIVPPVLSFSLGSLGFLTPFDFAEYRKHLNHVMGGTCASTTTTPPRQSGLSATRTSGLVSPPPQIPHSSKPHPKRADATLSALSTLNLTPSNPRSHSPASAVPPSPDLIADAGMRVNLRMRFTCAVWRANTPAAVAAGAPSHTETASFEVLNELVIDRGPSPYVSNLELYACDEDAAGPNLDADALPGADAENLLTVIQADGVIFSTPTGSTAYSLSAGGSLVHPDIPAILLTPICPHTLSFRPMLLDDAMALRVAVPRGSRATAWCSFDGKGRVELRGGDWVCVKGSRYPFPVVEGGGKGNGRGRWIDTVSRTLRWNTREARQKAWTKSRRGAGVEDAVGGVLGRELLDEDEGDEGFDIDFEDADADDEGLEGFSTKDSGYGGEMDGVSSKGPLSSAGGTGNATPVRSRSGGAVGLGC